MGIPLERPAALQDLPHVFVACLDGSRENGPVAQDPHSVRLTGVIGTLGGHLLAAGLEEVK